MTAYLTVDLLVVALAAYLLGAIPWGLIVVRLLKGVDIRQYGSGRIGMTNVLRTAGGKVAGVVVVLDVSKGVLAVLLAHLLIQAPDTALGEVVAALAAIIGHNWSLFLRFQGGRGIATAGGALLLMVPIAGAGATAAWVLVTLVTRYASVGSVAAVAAGAIALLLLTLLGSYPWEYLVYMTAASIILIWQHRENFRRLVQGRELRLGEKAPPIASPGQEREGP
ncbi:MAG: glycerol-3-phosphate 1-O-acyltransferase PlsY [Dehalococcoidia bacterium]